MTQKSNRSPYLVSACGLVSLVGGLALVTVFMNRHPRPQIVAQATPEQLSPPPAPTTIDSNKQASPQGPTGPLKTESGGAPAASPQGDTPAGMQAAPQGSDKAIRSPSK